MAYQIKFCDDNESIIDIFDNSVISSLEWNIVENDAGTLHAVLPQLWDWSYFQPYRTLILERDTGAGYAIVENRRWFLQDWAFGTDEQGNHYTEITARDQNILLDGYVNAYPQGDAKADRTDQYDDLCKLFVTDNMVSPTDTTRTLAGITVATGVGDAPEDTVSMSYKNGLALCREFANASQEEGTYLVFDLVNTGAGTYEMRTYIDQHGVDHSMTGGDPRVITLRNARIETKWSEARNVITAGGMGSKAARIVKTATNTAALAYSKFCRREAFVSASGTETEDAVQAVARAELYKTRPKVILTGTIEETPGLQYGIDYGWGDLLTAQYRGISVDCHVVAVGATYNAGKEELQITVRGEV
jgi:hypothetical protein